jgi:DNA helicase-2/ATP-dependent DNA helicase PcrA
MNTKIIIAGPGTGKTREIIHLVNKFLIETDNSKDGFILCTFTRKAAEELHFRIFEVIDPKLLVGRHYLIDTIHSISLSLLKLHPDGKYAEFDVIPEEESSSYINGKLPRLGFDRDEYKGSALWDLCSEISQIYGYITDREISLNELHFENNIKLETIISSYQTYIKLLMHDNKLDFALVQSVLKKELQTSASFKKIISDRYVHFFVDEYQDTNPMQHSLILELVKPDYKIVVVGDDDQSIYGFRGAAVENLIELPKFMHAMSQNYDLEFLEYNHRSTAEIVALSRNFIETSGIKGFDKNIQSFRGAGNVLPVVNEYESTDQELMAVARSIQSLYNEKKIESYEQVAILLRTAKNRGKDFGTALDKLNIPFNLIGVGDFFELQFVQEFLAILNFVFDISLESIQNFRSNLFDIEPNLAEYYFDGEVIIKIIDIKDNWRNFKSSTGISYDLMNVANFFDRFEKDGPNLGKLTQIIMNYDESMQNLDLFGLYSYISYLRREKLVDIEHVYNSDAVQIMTLHKAKGLQFDAVYMPSQNQLNPKQSTVDEFKNIAGISGDFVSDELRLFYVGITRARNYLWISRSKASPAGKKIYKPSVGFQNICKSNSLYKIQDHFDSTDILKATPRIIKKMSILSYNSIYTYQICPKQYMYRNVWRLDTARNAGMAYGTNLHKALQLVNVYLQNGVLATDIDVFAIMDVAWKDSWRSNDRENLKFKNTATNQLSAYVQNYANNFKNYTITGIEKQFDISLDDSLITGRFDMLVSNSSGTVIIDFKTGTKRDYSFQLSFYEYCLKLSGYETEIESWVYYLNDSSIQKPKILDSAQIENLIISTKDDIENRNFNATPGEHCVDCSFNLMCSEGLARSKSKI